MPFVFFGGSIFLILAYFLAAVALFELLKMRKIELFTVPGMLTLHFYGLFLLPFPAQEIIGRNQLFKNRFRIISEYYCF